MPISESTKPRSPLSCKVDREMRLCWYRTSDRGMWGWGGGGRRPGFPKRGLKAEIANVTLRGRKASRLHMCLLICKCYI
jgi:hypothetical protein